MGNEIVMYLAGGWATVLVALIALFVWLRAGMARMEARLNARIDGVEKNLNARIDGLEARMGAMERRMGALEQRMARMEGMFEIFSRAAGLPSPAPAGPQPGARDAA